MAKVDILNILYSRERSPLEFHFDNLIMPSLYNFLTIQDIEMLRKIATSARYAAKIELKYKAIDDIMRPRGFKKFHCGTNRIVYKYLESEFFLVKIALDEVGMGDNPREYVNQNFLKPFVTKVFEISPCGTVATVERVQPITSRQEFISIADDVFDLITNCLIGKYVIDDFGTKYFMNYGLRDGYGPVLLDYPYVYELDGKKMYCNKVDPYTKIICGGEIDYDIGFNDLICKKCGKNYLAQELQNYEKDGNIILKDEGDISMKISLMLGDEVLGSTHNTGIESEVILQRVTKTMRVIRSSNNVRLERDGDIINRHISKPTIIEREDKRANNNNDRNNKGGKKGNFNKDFRDKDKKQYNPNNNNQNRKSDRSSQSTKFDSKYSPKEENVNPKPVSQPEKHLSDSELIKIREEIRKSVDYIETPKDTVKSEKIDFGSAFGISSSDFEEPKDTKQSISNIMGDF